MPIRRREHRRVNGRNRSRRPGRRRRGERLDVGRSRFGIRRIGQEDECETGCGDLDVTYVVVAVDGLDVEGPL